MNAEHTLAEDLARKMGRIEYYLRELKLDLLYSNDPKRKAEAAERFIKAVEEVK